MTRTYHGSCHCGAVKWEADGDLANGTGKCNCSICGKLRAWSFSVKPAEFRLLQGEGELVDYQFNTHSTNNFFCRKCGVHSFSRGDIPEVGGKFVSLQVSCIDDVTPEELAAVPVHYSNGRDNDWPHEPKVTSYL